MFFFLGFALLYIRIYCMYIVEPEAQMFSEIKSAKIDVDSESWKFIDVKAKHLVNRMLNRNPKERISAAEVLGKFVYDCSIFLRF